jgi:hypothetical protein
VVDLSFRDSVHRPSERVNFSARLAIVERNPQGKVLLVKFTVAKLVKIFTNFMEP